MPSVDALIKARSRSPAPVQADPVTRSAVGDGDLRLGPRIEREAVGFDAVAEDDAVFRHQGADAEPLGFRQFAIDQVEL